MKYTLLALASLLTSFAAAGVLEPNVLLERQTDCSVYGEYEPYTGPCEYENCQGKNCKTTGWSGCVVYPSEYCTPNTVPSDAKD